jgi:LMBR1 domain-containing protein 1
VVTIRPTLVVYAIALTSWVGWVFLVVFGGIGLAAIPMDLINDFRTRPKTLKNTKEGKEQCVAGRRLLVYLRCLTPPLCVFVDSCA